MAPSAGSRSLRCCGGCCACCSSASPRQGLHIFDFETQSEIHENLFSVVQNAVTTQKLQSAFLERQVMPSWQSTCCVAQVCLAEYV